LEEISSNELSYRLKEDPKPDWQIILQEAAYIPVSYLSVMLSYQNQYLKEKIEDYHDISLILEKNNTDIGVWPLSIWRSFTGWNIGSFGGPIQQPILCKKIGAAENKRILSICLSSLLLICKKLQIQTFQSGEIIRNQGMGLWQKRIKNYGSSSNISFESFVDMNLDLAVIRGNIRKSYRPLITKAERTWDSEIIDTPNPDIWEEFRELHARVAGRVTRSGKTWYWQEMAVEYKEAFLVVLRNASKEMVGCGLFYISRDEGLYAVAAYDRTLFDMPLGHLVQWKAIEYMKQKKLRWYRIGARPYPGDIPEPGEKEISIGHFKEGFATHSFPNLLLTMQINPD